MRTFLVHSSPINYGVDDQAIGINSSEQDDPWSRQFEEALTSGDTLFSEDLSRDVTRVPDGASIDDSPGAVTSGEESRLIKTRREDDLISSDDEDDEQSKHKKKKMNLLACLGPRARISFRKKKNQKTSEQKSEKSNTNK
jgi:hypothetical protein